MAFTLSVSQSPGGKPTAVRVAEVVRKGDPRAPGPLPLLALHCAWPQSRVSVLISCLFLLYLATGTCAPPPFSISSVMSRKQPEPHLTPRGQRERVNHRAGRRERGHLTAAVASGGAEQPEGPGGPHPWLLPSYLLPEPPPGRPQLLDSAGGSGPWAESRWGASLEGKWK